LVANADRFLPYADGSFHAVATITARLDAGELHRVLAPDGSLLVVVPAADDLVELREAPASGSQPGGRMPSPALRTASRARCSARAVPRGR
jgi:hypothetical protein